MSEIEPTLWSIVYIPAMWGEAREAEFFNTVGVDMDLDTAEMLAKEHYAGVVGEEAEGIEIDECWYNSVKEVDGHVVILARKDEV